MKHLIEKDLKVLDRVDKALITLLDLGREDQLTLVSARVLLTKLSLSLTRKLIKTQNFISPELEHKENNDV